MYILFMQLYAHCLRIQTEWNIIREKSQHAHDLWKSFDWMILRRLEWHSLSNYRALPIEKLQKPYEFTGLIQVELQAPWSGRLYQWSVVQIVKLWQLPSSM